MEMHARAQGIQNPVFVGVKRPSTHERDDEFEGDLSKRQRVEKAQ